MAKKRFRNRGLLWQWVGLVLLGLVAAGVVGYALVPAKVPPSVALPSVTPTPTQTVAPKPTAVFLGDSYTQGTGSSTPNLRWSSLVSQKMGWAEDNMGRGGTAYVAVSDVNGCGLVVCPNYQEMVDAAVAHKPAVVVVAGGQNDLSLFMRDPATVTDAINKTYRTLRNKLPDARIVAVGPSTPWGVGAPITGLDRAVQDAAAAVSATYVSLIAPDVIDPANVLPDKAHVNNAGHAAIAERVIAALR